MLRADRGLRYKYLVPTNLTWAMCLQKLSMCQDPHGLALICAESMDRGFSCGYLVTFRFDPGNVTATTEM